MVNRLGFSERFYADSTLVCEGLWCQQGLVQDSTHVGSKRQLMRDGVALGLLYSYNMLVGSCQHLLGWNGLSPGIARCRGFLFEIIFDHVLQL